MEPLTTLTYMLTSFIGYYITSDIWNYMKFQSQFQEINRRLNTMEYSLRYLTSK